MPAFTIGRVYDIVQGKNYNPGANGNTALKFRGVSTSGTGTITFSTSEAVISKIAAIQASSGTAVISGPGFTGRPVISATGATSISVSGVAFNSGTSDFYLYDVSRPSNLDSPIQAIHIVAAPGNVVLVTPAGDSVSLPASSLVVGGVYDYSVAQLSTLTNAGTIRGLAPAYYSGSY
jgi:hypothetical protein